MCLCDVQAYTVGMARNPRHVCLLVRVVTRSPPSVARVAMAAYSLWGAAPRPQGLERERYGASPRRERCQLSQTPTFISLWASLRMVEALCLL